MMTSKTPAPVLYINGHPGVGKLTIARSLHPLLLNSRILHNHEIIDPVHLTHPRGCTSYQAKRSEFRQEKLKEIKSDPELRDVIFIFTDSQVEYNDCVSDYTDLALSDEKGPGRRLYSIILECELEENCRRLVMGERGKGEKGKLVDVKTLREYRSRGGVLRFEEEDELVIDVTKVTAAEAAGSIKSFFEGREKEAREECDI